MDYIIENIPFWIALIILIIRVVTAAKRGLVQEICSLIAMLAGCIVIIALAFAVRNYLDQDKIVFVVTLFLIAIFGLVYKLLSGFLEAIKLVSKLPVIKVADKILGVVIGVAETVLIVWLVYSITDIMNASIIAEYIYACADANPVMGFLRDNNLITGIIAPFTDSISNINF